MSLWGDPNFALYNNILNYKNFYLTECLDMILLNKFLNPILNSNINLPVQTNKLIETNKIKANLRIGPHNSNILAIIFGSLLGDGYAEHRSKGTRIAFYQEGYHDSYLLWLHNLISNLGYCNPTKPQITTRLGSKGTIRKVIRFKT
jgi:hypothetical protein